TAGTPLDGLKEAAGEAVLAPADLGAAGVATIVRSELGKVTDEVASACAEVTGGNPFLLVELLAEVRRSGADASSLTASRLLELSPEAVATRIASRLGELPDEARLLAWALAAIDCPASIARCAAVAGIDVATAARVSDMLVESRLLAPDLPLRFARPLAARVLLASIPAGEREQLKRRARETESSHSDNAAAVPPVDRPLTPEQHLALAQVAIRSALRGDRRDRVAHLAELAWGDGALLGTRSGEACATATVLAGGLLLVDELDRSLEIAFHPELRDPRNHPPEIRIAACHSRAWALYHQGRITASLAEAQRTQRVLAQGGTSTDNSLNGVIAVCHIQRGELDEAESALSMLANPESVAEVDLPTLLDVRAQLRLAQGLPEEALSDASSAGRRLRQLHPDSHPGIVAWRSTAALAMLALGRRMSALRSAEEELELAQSVDATRTIIRSLRVCGHSTEGEPGLQRLAEAVNAGRGRPLRLEYALALIDLGTAMRHSRRHYIGDGLLRQALRLCERLGATAAAARAREEIEAGAGRVRKRKGIGVTALTPSERRVALLAARGATTRQIATELFVTPKAVEFHLRNIYLKLGIPSTRADLARALRSIATQAEDVPDATTPEDGRRD
ncbi:MAG: helix-turn-helix transcriptional regulator, partial [Solirubrobacteraceae bacterium]